MRGQGGPVSLPQRKEGRCNGDRPGSIVSVSQSKYGLGVTCQPGVLWTQATASPPCTSAESPWFVLFLDPSALMALRPGILGDSMWEWQLLQALPLSVGPRSEGTQDPRLYEVFTVSHNFTLALRPSEGNSGPGTGWSPVSRAQGIAFSEAKEGAFLVSPSSLVQ